jgi:putative peptidoglycan lipid II flippase
MPLPITVVLFERGAFDRDAAEATAAALAAFAIGLPAYVLVKVLQPAFFAREDTVTPLKITAASVVTNVVLSLVLFWPLRHVGIALATALAMWLNTGLLAVSLKRRGLFALDARCRARLVRAALASLLMAGALWVGMWALGGWFDARPGLRIAGLVVLVAGGLVLYGLLALALGAVRPGEIRALLGRG